jgi:hypothetical protein
MGFALVGLFYGKLAEKRAGNAPPQKTNCPRKAGSLFRTCAPKAYFFAICTFLIR